MHNSREPERAGDAPQGEAVQPRLRPQSRQTAADPLSDSTLPGPVIRLLRQFPALRRHPHPFVVHFPIVFFLAAAFFTLAYLVIGANALETTAFHCLWAGVLSLPAAMLTGEFSRRVNYPQDPSPTFRIEIRYSRLLLLLSSSALLWRWLSPAILQNFRWAGVLYLLLIFSLPVLVTVISYYGGLLTFPLEGTENP
jgi:uncharacterized membrane protein